MSLNLSSTAQRLVEILPDRGVYPLLIALFREMEAAWRDKARVEAVAYAARANNSDDSNRVNCLECHGRANGVKYLCEDLEAILKQTGA
jgi:cytochrome c553